MTLLLALVAASIALSLLVGYKVGLKRGQAAETLRIDLIFYAATDYVVGGVHNILWDRIRDRNTDEQFHARLADYVESKKSK